MLKIEKNKNLEDYNTFRLKAKADYFAIISNEEDLIEAIKWAKEKDLEIFVLGGGSNILLSQDLKNTLVLKNEIQGLEIIKEDKERVHLKAMSGKLWSALVRFCIENNWSGIENLYHIPGTVGAAPVQNIGAYGLELKDAFLELEAMHLKTAEKRIFNKEELKFAYRQSVFKNELKGQYFILSISLILSKELNLKLNYADIQAELKEWNIEKPSLKQLSDIIRVVRDRKLPDPKILANAGSFFKNPEISQEKLKELQLDYPDIKYYPGSQESLVKLPAAWLIDQAGFKGKRFNNVGMYEHQALVLVNYGGASAKELLEQVARVKEAVKEKFGVEIEPEVNII